MVLARLLADAEDATKSGTLHSKLKQAIQVGGCIRIQEMNSSQFPDDEGQVK